MNPVSNTIRDFTEQEIDERLEAVDKLAFRLYGIDLNVCTITDLVYPPVLRTVQDLTPDSDQESEETSDSSPATPPQSHSPQVSLSDFLEDDTTVAKPEERQDPALAVHTALKDALMNLGTAV